MDMLGKMRMPVREVAAMMVVVALLSTAAEAALPAAVMLERGLPLKGLKDLRELDKARHARTGAVNFSVEGSFLPMGLYYTTVKLGNPPQKHTFQIDTGSSIPWVNCKGCTGCSSKTLATELYNPQSSSTSSTISCSDDRCDAADQSGSGLCQSNLCGFNISYGDQTTAAGYYVSDTMYFDTIMGNHTLANYSALFVFGCTSSLNNVMRTDGLLGFGRDPLSLISQLNSQGISPKAFSHCLKGSEEGGGTLVLGKIVAPGLVFTPLVAKESLYNLKLESIAVNGKKLPIDSSVFATSDSQGTVVDSGTTLAYLVEGAHGPMASAIAALLPPSVQPIDTSRNEWPDNQDKCFISSGSMDMLFPVVTMYFKGGAAMAVKPSQYLMERGSYVERNESIRCIAWQSSQVLPNVQGLTLVGDIILRDKLIVYDLGKRSLGWTDYNCSSLNTTSPVDVSGASSYNYSGGFIGTGMAAIWIVLLI